jgi:hypothetical protein
LNAGGNKRSARLGIHLWIFPLGSDLACDRELSIRASLAPWP